MTVVYERFGIQAHLGEALTVLRTLPDSSVHSIVTDPPAGIAFMGCGWDRDRGGRDRWVDWLTERMDDDDPRSPGWIRARLDALPKTEARPSGDVSDVSDGDVPDDVPGDLFTLLDIS